MRDRRAGRARADGAGIALLSSLRASIRMRTQRQYALPQEPAGVPHAFAAAWNERDANGIAALFDEDAEFVNVVGIWWHDREAVRRAHAYGLARIFNNSTLRVGSVRVRHMSDTIAVVHARMSLTGQTPVGGVASPGARTNIFSFVVHRTPVGWSCASAHNTDVVPGMETNLADASGSLRPVDYRYNRDTQPELNQPAQDTDTLN